MRTRVMVLVSLVSMVLAGSAGATIIYQNDFGTQAQQDEFLSTFTVTGPTLSFGGVGSTSPKDITGDGLASYFYHADTTNAFTYCNAAFTAPEGFVYDDIAFSFHVNTDKTNYDARAYLVISSTPNFAEGTCIQVGGINALGVTLTADTSGVAGFENLETVYVRVQVRNTSPASQGKAYVYSIQGQADVVPVPEPISLSLLGLGTLLMIKRKR